MNTKQKIALGIGAFFTAVPIALITGYTIDYQIRKNMQERQDQIVAAINNDPLIRVSDEAYFWKAYQNYQEMYDKGYGFEGLIPKDR